MATRLQGQRAPTSRLQGCARTTFWFAALAVLALGDERDHVDEVIDRVLSKVEAERKSKGTTTPALVVLVRSRGGDREVIERFLDRSAGDASSVLEEADENGATAMWHAVMDGHLEIADLLAERGANLNVQKRPAGLTPLMTAAMSNNVPMVEMLLSRGAVMDIQATDAGATALLLAFLSSYVEMGELLVERGAKADLSKRAWKNLVLTLMKTDSEQNTRMIQLITESIADDAVSMGWLLRLEEQAEKLRAHDEKQGGQGSDGTPALEDWDEDFEFESEDGAKDEL